MPRPGWPRCTGPAGQPARAGWSIRSWAASQSCRSWSAGFQDAIEARIGTGPPPGPAAKQIQHQPDHQHRLASPQLTEHHQTPGRHPGQHLHQLTALSSQAHPGSAAKASSRRRPRPPGIAARQLHQQSPGVDQGCVRWNPGNRQRVGGVEALHSGPRLSHCLPTATASWSAICARPGVLAEVSGFLLSRWSAQVSHSTGKPSAAETKTVTVAISR